MKVRLTAQRPICGTLWCIYNFRFRTTMKKTPCLLIILSILIFISCNKEKGFTISGRITGIADSTQVMLQNISTGEYIDSSLVINSEFTFKGQLADEPEELRIISGLEELKKGNLFYTDLLMGNEDVHLEADISDLPYNVNTSGSPTQDKAEHYRKQLYAWNVKLDSLNNHFKSFPDSIDTPEKKQAAIRIKEVKDSLENWKINFIKENFNSYISLLTYNYRRDFNVDTLKRLFSSVSEELKQSKYGEAIATQISYPKPQIGEAYNDFEAISPKEAPIKLSEINGQYILLQFAGTGCYWSNLSIQKMKTIHEKYKDSISFVSYFVDPQKQSWLKYTDDNNIPWLSLWAAGGKYSDPHNKYGITGTPTFFLISPDKKIISSWFGYDEGIIEKEIQEAFAEINTHHNMAHNPQRLKE